MAMERTHNDPITFEIADHLAVISHKPDGWNKELNLVSWNGQQPPKFDIREWSPDHTKMSRGITLFDTEMRKVCRAYTKFCNARIVQEGINNRNAAAAAGMRAGQEAARMHEEAEEEARAKANANAEEMIRSQEEHYPDAPDDVEYAADDFDAPGLAETVSGFESNDAAVREREEQVEHTENYNGIIPPVSGEAASSGQAEEA